MWEPRSRRVAVLGAYGAGKTTPARRLGEQTGLPVTHLDSVTFMPDRTKVAPAHGWTCTVECSPGKSGSSTATQSSLKIYEKRPSRPLSQVPDYCAASALASDKAAVQRAAKPFKARMWPKPGHTRSVINLV
jgi:hypothetical protein